MKPVELTRIQPFLDHFLAALSPGTGEIRSVFRLRASLSGGAHLLIALLPTPPQGPLPR